MEEDGCELIRNTPEIVEGVRQPLMTRAMRCLETQGKNWAFLYNLLSKQ